MQDDRKEEIVAKKLKELDQVEEYILGFPSPDEYKLGCIKLAREILNSDQWEMLKDVHLNASWLWFESSRTYDKYYREMNPRGLGIVFEEIQMSPSELEALRAKKLEQLAMLESDCSEKLKVEWNPTIVRSLNTKLEILKETRTVLESDEWVTLKSVHLNRSWLRDEAQKRDAARSRFYKSR